MRATCDDARALLPELTSLNLEVTLFGGQAFRWRRDDVGRISGWIGGRPVRVAARPEGLEVVALDGRDDGLAEAARHYFDAARDYAAIERRVFRDTALRRAASRVAGFRILRQPAFEALVGFITSANNNIVRFSRSLDAISRIAGRAVETELGTMWAFPGPSALASIAPERLREEANLGYRDRYVAGAARMIASGEVDLEALDLLPTAELREALRTVPGVGPKVADCIALYGFGRIEVFPVDTWVRKAYAALYLPEGGRIPDRAIARLATDRFGPYAGIAQQYMFEAFRRKLDSLDSRG